MQTYDWPHEALSSAAASRNCGTSQTVNIGIGRLSGYLGSIFPNYSSRTRGGAGGYNYTLLSNPDTFFPFGIVLAFSKSFEASDGSTVSNDVIF